MATSEKPRMLIATHKLAAMPQDELYLPIHVGRALSSASLGYQPDNTGENISILNRSYCELTALYWGWKNLNTDVIGLCHYRRYFIGEAQGPGRRGVLSAREVGQIMQEHDLVLGKPRNYYIETIESHYRNGHYGSDLEALHEVIARASPQYLEAYNEVFCGRRLSLYNMFLMRREYFNAYADWLFGVLREVESSIDNDSRSNYQRRTFGYLAERLLNVWTVAHHKQLRIQYRKVINTEGEPKVQKGVNLLKRKLIGDKGRWNGQ